MKKAFTLFSVLILLFIFSIVAIRIYEVKSINSLNIINKYKYIQGKNHLMFLESYVKKLDEVSTLNNISFNTSDFEANAHFFEQTSNYKVQLEVVSNSMNIRLQKVIFITK